MLKSYILITVLLLSDYLAYLFTGVSLAGQWSDKLLLWTWLLLTIVVVVKYIKRRATKIYIGAILFLTFLSLLPMAIPFLMFITYITDSEGDFEYRVEDFRLREGNIGLFSTPIIRVVKNYGIFEVEVDIIDLGENTENCEFRDAKSIRIIKENNIQYFEFKIGEDTFRRMFNDSWNKK